MVANSAPSRMPGRDDRRDSERGEPKPLTPRFHLGLFLPTFSS